MGVYAGPAAGVTWMGSAGRPGPVPRTDQPPAGSITPQAMRPPAPASAS